MLNYIRGTADTFNTILYPGQWITVRFCYVIYFPKINTKTDEACQTYQPSNRESSELELGSASPCSCHVANLSLQTAVFVRINTVWMCALGDRLRLIMLWDGHSRGYIRKQHLICQNQLHNVYNVDRCISNSKKLFFLIKQDSHHITRDPGPGLLSGLSPYKNSSATSWKSRCLTSSDLFLP